MIIRLIPSILIATFVQYAGADTNGFNKHDAAWLSVQTPVLISVVGTNGIPGKTCLKASKCMIKKDATGDPSHAGLDCYGRRGVLDAPGGVHYVSQYEPVYEENRVKLVFRKDTEYRLGRAVVKYKLSNKRHSLDEFIARKNAVLVF